MRLYEINERLDELLLSLEPDPETGEVTGDIESVIAEISTLEEDRTSVLKYLAGLAIDAKAQSAMIKEEEKRLKSRRDAYDRKAEKLLEILDRECAGKKTDLGIATVCYRKTTRIEVSDEDTAISWLMSHDKRECYRTPKPEISKSNVKKLLQEGVDVPGTVLVEDVSCSLR